MMFGNRARGARITPYDLPQDEGLPFLPPNAMTASGISDVVASLKLSPSQAVDAATSNPDTRPSLRGRRNVFGAPLLADTQSASAAPRTQVLTSSLTASPENLDNLSGGPSMANDNSTTLMLSQQLATAKARKPGFGEPGGWGEKLQALAAGLMSMGGDEAGAQRLTNVLEQRRRERSDQQNQSALWAHQAALQADERHYEANKPQFRSVGNEFVRYDPNTNETTRLYQGRSPAEEYAAAQGLDPSTAEGQSAMQDFVLRGNGPTAYGYDVGLEGAKQDHRVALEGVRQQDRVGLEGVRQGNRVGLEGARQGNRMAVRGAPTYRDLHPTVTAKPPTPGTVLGGIYQKWAGGQQLTPQEQALLTTSTASGRHPGVGGANMGGGMPSGHGIAAGGSAQVPVKVTTPDQARNLPKGTYFQTPDGRVKVR